MTDTKYLGIARCKNRRCGFGFGLVDEESRRNCLEKKIVCPLCGNKIEVIE